MAEIEQHPLEPFLPPTARVLMLGSFPPPRKRWSMEFFYPNLQNDMWRIIGLLAAGEKGYFLADEKHFDRTRIVHFCQEKGLALYDTSKAVIRLKENASDEFLQVVEEVDLSLLIDRLPRCTDLVATGGKAAEIIAGRLNRGESPRVGEYLLLQYGERTLRFWRMPSSSRAFPRSIEWKAEFYRKLFVASGIF